MNIRQQKTLFQNKNLPKSTQKVTEYHIFVFHRFYKPLKHMFRHQNQFPMSILDKVMAKKRFLQFTLAAISNFAYSEKCSRVTKWHQAVLGSVGSVLPESPRKRCMYSETHLGHKFVFCHQTIT